MAINISNGRKIYQYCLCNLRPSKIYPNWDFWFENIPSGNPDEKRRKSDQSGERGKQRMEGG
jgi:hypothetical protein